MKCLIAGAWLNDQVINYRIGLLQERENKQCELDPSRRYSLFMNTFFFAKLFGDSKTYNYDAVRRWTKKVDVFTCEKIFIPINIDNGHWVLACILPQARKIIWHDSKKNMVKP